MNKEPTHDFRGLSDLDLVRMQHQLRAFPEDKDFLHAVLVELGNRQKTHDLNDKEKADWMEYCQSAGICPYCGKPIVDDMEANQGHHDTAPCNLWATGQIEAARKWEAEHTSPSRALMQKAKLDP